MNTLPGQLTTGIGSLPGTDVDRAVSAARSVTPELAVVPSLPAGGESMLAQAAEGMTGVEVASDGSLSMVGTLDPYSPFAVDAVDEGSSFATFRAFLDRIGPGSEPIKVQMTGPLTLATGLVAAGATVAAAVDVAGTAVAARADQILKRVAETVPGRPVVAFVDEPSLAVASESGFPLAQSDVVDLVSGALATLESRAVSGLHCCGRADWKLALATGPDVLSLPVGAGLELFGGPVNAFLDRGGLVAWGAVPTTGPQGLSAERLWDRLSGQWDSLARAGCVRGQLVARSWLTPECGLAGLAWADADGVWAALAELAKRLRAEALAVRSAL